MIKYNDNIFDIFSAIIFYDEKYFSMIKYFEYFMMKFYDDKKILGIILMMMRMNEMIQ